jgi:hypothetical protein
MRRLSSSSANQPGTRQIMAAEGMLAGIAPGLFIYLRLSMKNWNASRVSSKA